MSGVYRHPRGADLHITAQWLDETGTPINLTGVTLAPFEIVPAALAASITMTVTVPLQGTFTIDCPWGDSWPDGIGRLVTIRAKPSNGGALSIPIPLELV